MSVWLCVHCKQWVDNYAHTCKPRFCECKPGKECAFHKRGGYVTSEDDK